MHLEEVDVTLLVASAEFLDTFNNKASPLGRNTRELAYRIFNETKGGCTRYLFSMKFIKVIKYI